MEVVVTASALEEFTRVPRPIQARVLQLVSRLERWPEVSGAKPLTGRLAGHYRLRTGDYRVQFRLDKERLVVEQLDIETDSMMSSSDIAQTIVLDGKRFVILPEAEFRRITALPAPDAKGNRPAVAAMRAVLARDIISDRERVGWTQAELARRAGIRVETLNRIETGKHTPSVDSIEKIDAALRTASRKTKRQTGHTK